MERSSVWFKPRVPCPKSRIWSHRGPFCLGFLCSLVSDPVGGHCSLNVCSRFKWHLWPPFPRDLRTQDKFQSNLTIKYYLILSYLKVANISDVETQGVDTQGLFSQPRWWCFDTWTSSGDGIAERFNGPPIIRLNSGDQQTNALGPHYRGWRDVSCWERISSLCLNFLAYCRW